MIQDTDLMAPAELYLCLSKAFLTPVTQVTLDDLNRGLLPDLQELSTRLPAIADTWLHEFGQALTGIHTSQQLLVGYSKLFLMPPAPAPLNLGAYLDDSAAGQGSRMIEAFYFRHQLTKRDDFHDLPDHLALTLQWYAWVMSQVLEAQGEADTEMGAEPLPEQLSRLQDLHVMTRDYTFPAVKILHQKIVECADEARPEQRLWRLLVELTHCQLQRELAWLEPLIDQHEVKTFPFHTPHGDEAAVAKRAGDDGNEYGNAAVVSAPQSCGRCGAAFIPSAILSEMRQRLEQAGLTADHLMVCADCSEVDTSRTGPRPLQDGQKGADVSHRQSS